jgi:hypothetical protein
MHEASSEGELLYSHDSIQNTFQQMQEEVFTVKLCLLLVYRRNKFIYLNNIEHHSSAAVKSGRGSYKSVLEIILIFVKFGKHIQ